MACHGFETVEAWRRGQRRPRRAGRTMSGGGAGIEGVGGEDQVRAKACLLCPRETSAQS